MMKAGLQNLLQGGALALLVFVLDQWSKVWALGALAGRKTLEIFPGLDLVLAFNQGISFGLFKADSLWGHGMLVGGALLIIFVFVVWLFKSAALLQRLALGLILGGALGNVFDRFSYGFVVDFIDVHWHNHHWYTFNIADAAITCGAACLLLEALVLEPRRGKR